MSGRDAYFAYMRDFNEREGINSFYGSDKKRFLAGWHGVKDKDRPDKIRKDIPEPPRLAPRPPSVQEISEMKRMGEEDVDAQDDDEIQEDLIDFYEQPNKEEFEAQLQQIYDSLKAFARLKNIIGEININNVKKTFKINGRPSAALKQRFYDSFINNFEKLYKQLLAALAILKRKNPFKTNYAEMQKNAVLNTYEFSPYMGNGNKYEIYLGSNRIDEDDLDIIFNSGYGDYESPYLRAAGALSIKSKKFQKMLDREPKPPLPSPVRIQSEDLIRNIMEYKGISENAEKIYQNISQMVFYLELYKKLVKLMKEGKVYQAPAHGVKANDISYFEKIVDNVRTFVNKNIEKANKAYKGLYNFADKDMLKKYGLLGSMDNINQLEAAGLSQFGTIGFWKLDNRYRNDFREENPTVSEGNYQYWSGPNDFYFRPYKSKKYSDLYEDLVNDSNNVDLLISRSKDNKDRGNRE